LVENLTRIEDQVRARGWDVTVVAPEWRRRSELRLGAWRKALHRRGRPSPMPVPILKAGLRKDAVMKIATNYFEDRREALFDALGAQTMADVIGYAAHRDSVHAILRTELTAAAKAARGRPVLPVALSLGGIAAPRPGPEVADRRAMARPYTPGGSSRDGRTDPARRTTGAPCVERHGSVTSGRAR
jgi:hypothetical protein